MYQATHYIRQWLLICCLLAQLANCNQCGSPNSEGNGGNSNTIPPSSITKVMIEQAAGWKRGSPGMGFELLVEVLTDLKDGNNTTINKRGKNGRTALHFAACTGNPHMVKALLERNANPDLQDNYSSTPFHSALLYSYLDVALLLINSNKISKASLEASVPLKRLPEEKVKTMTALAHAQEEVANVDSNQEDWQAIIDALKAAGVTQ
jgi:hypothetical protein